MKFPGRRKSKHYFPQSEKARLAFDQVGPGQNASFIMGLCQLLVDIEANVTEELLSRYKIKKGESLVLPDNVVEELYNELKEKNLIEGEYAGGAVGNTLHNYCILSDCQSILLGSITETIRVGDYAFKYICNTHSSVNLDYLRPCPGPMGRALCLVTPDFDRTFVISRGIMDDFESEDVPVHLLAKSSALLITSFLMRDPSRPIYKAVLRAVEVAKANNVPVVLGLGTAGVIGQNPSFYLDFIKEYVNVVAGNKSEYQALLGIDDSLLSLEKLLDYTDMALLTVGARGLYIGAHCDHSLLRTTKDHLHSKSIAEYNLYEYSRAQRKSDCQVPTKIYTHINPYMGGPMVIKNTNGAGDAALAAVLHDMAANNFHKQKFPNSPKHVSSFLTYSSIHQISKYANRASYEVLLQNSPRLLRGLPDKEDSLEESYWAK